MAKLSITLVAALLTFAVEGSLIDMPSFAFIGENAWLQCKIDHGDLPLTITWTKDGNQFYKYDPNQADPITITKIPGVQIKELSGDGMSIVLEKVTMESTGVYRCHGRIDHPTIDVADLTGSFKVIENNN